jgi:hypothetical protein
VERLVLPPMLVRPATNFSAKSVIDGENEHIVYLDASHLLDSFVHQEKLAGWSPFSGHTLETEALEQTFVQIERVLQDIDLKDGQQLTVQPSVVRERSGKSSVKNAEKNLRAVVFGYGHLAKTIVIPNSTMS